MNPADLFQKAEEAAAALRPDVPGPPDVAVVLGSGLGALADSLSDKLIRPYGTIPHFPRPTVPGHGGNLVFGTLGKARVVVLQGRFHFYEGYDLATVTFPIRVLQRMGVRTLILTAATGGIAPHLRPGDMVCVYDHLNLIGLNPLRGPNDDRLGTRFPDMTEVYSPGLNELAVEEADRLGLSLTSAVYACLPGPSYETPAEIRMLRHLGADVVGMSIVPEAIVARHAGLDVLALAVVSNAAAGISPQPITHEEVLEAGRLVGPRLSALLGAVIGRIVPG